VTRLRELLGGSGMLGLDAMAAAQRDVTVRGVRRVRDALLARLGSTRPVAARALADWDGSYTVASRGAQTRRSLAPHLLYMQWMRTPPMRRS
jgi:hypothetical protein